ncbi:MAG: hypothetical protein K2X93_29100 [Candidatus Obscuribacterales bacterium]|nr:hypothetical protein [Candidatus Obscuribacterales bacterium]
MTVRLLLNSGDLEIDILRNIERLRREAAGYKRRGRTSRAEEIERAISLLVVPDDEGRVDELSVQKAA